MNFSLPSMMDLQKDKKRRQRQFIENQSQMNGQIKNIHLNNNYYVQAQQVIGLSTKNIPSPHKIKFKQDNSNSRIQGKILEQQLKLQKIENEYDLEKSRIQDQNNAKTYRIKYPYGKQNVKITQDVLQKYSANAYLNQSQILKKFQNQAKKLKQQKSQQKSCKKINLPQTNNAIDYLNMENKKRKNKKKASLLQSQLLRFQNRKQKKYVQKRQSLRTQDQDPQLQKIESIVNDIKFKLKNSSSSRLATDRTHVSRQDQFVNSLQKSRNRIKKLNFFQMQQEMVRQQLPIIVYTKDFRRKNQILQTINNDISQIDIDKPIQKHDEYNEVMKILNMNKRRLDILTHQI